MQVCRDLANGQPSCQQANHLQFAGRQLLVGLQSIRAQRAQRLANGVGYIAALLADLSDGFRQFIREAGFAQQAHDTQLQDGVKQPRVVEHGHHDNGQRRMMAAQLVDQAQAVGLGFARHHEIGDQQVAGTVLQQLGQGLGRVGFADNLQLFIALQDRPQTNQENRMVVGKDDAQGFFRCASQSRFPGQFGDSSLLTLWWLQVGF